MANQQICNNGEAYEVSCFGHFNYKEKECLQCPLRNKCSLKASGETRVWITDHKDGEHWEKGPALNGDREPPYKEVEDICPYCGEVIFADFKDIGLGVTQCGPFVCPSCKVIEVGAKDDTTGRETKFGFYLPGEPHGTSCYALDGKLLTFAEAQKAIKEGKTLDERKLVEPDPA